MKRGVKRFLFLFVLLILLAGALGAYWYLMPDQARRNLRQAQEFLESPKVRGVLWPKVQEGRFTVTFQDREVPSDYAEAVLRIALISEEVLDEKLGRSYSRPIDIFMFSRPGRGYVWTNGQDEIHLSYADSDDLLPPGLGGQRNHVAQIAHVLAQLVAQINSGESETMAPDDQATEALANYLEMVLLVPGLWKAEGELLWPGTYNFTRYAGRDLWARYASAPPDALAGDRFWTAWDNIWYRIDKRGGPETVGRVLNLACGPVGSTDVAGLAKATGEVTGDAELAGAIRALARQAD